MTDVKRLLDEATPLPWGVVMDHSLYDGPMIGAVGSLGPTSLYVAETANAEVGERDAALIVYAVNRLPDYEAAVEALHRIYMGRVGFDNPDDPDILAARHALARFR